MRVKFEDCKFLLSSSMDWSWVRIDIVRPAKIVKYSVGRRDTRTRLLFRAVLEKNEIDIRKEMPASATVNQLYKVCTSLLFWLDKKFPQQVWIKRQLKDLFWSKGYIQICSYCGKERVRKMRKISIYSACSRECERKIKKEIING